MIWPKIQNKFPQSFLFKWYEQKGVYSSTCVHSNLFLKYMSLYFRFCVDFDHENYHTDVFCLSARFELSALSTVCDLDPIIKELLLSTTKNNYNLRNNFCINTNKYIKSHFSTASRYKMPFSYIFVHRTPLLSPGLGKCFAFTETNGNKYSRAR